jgi:transposase
LGEPFASDSRTLGQETTVLEERPLAFSAGDTQKLGGWLLELVVRDPAEPEEEKKQFQPLKWRGIVERTFAWVGRNRRLSKDYAGSEESGESWIYLAMIHLLLRRLDPA